MPKVPALRRCYVGVSIQPCVENDLPKPTCLSAFPPADISTVICDKPDKARTLLDHVERRETPGLSSIILMDPFEKELTERGRRCGVRIQSMQEVEVGLLSLFFLYTLCIEAVKKIKTTRTCEVCGRVSVWGSWLLVLVHGSVRFVVASSLVDGRANISHFPAAVRHQLLFKPPPTKQPQPRHCLNPGVTL